jgi:hypothetical protein
MRPGSRTVRDLTRFDLDFDLPDRFLPEFPSPIYLTTRPDLGDVSRGQLVTSKNFYELFNGIMNPKRLEAYRLKPPAGSGESSFQTPSTIGSPMSRDRGLAGWCSK